MSYMPKEEVISRIQTLQAVANLFFPAYAFTAKAEIDQMNGNGLVLTLIGGEKKLIKPVTDIHRG